MTVLFSVRHRLAVRHGIKHVRHGIKQLLEVPDTGTNSGAWHPFDAWRVAYGARQLFDGWSALKMANPSLNVLMHFSKMILSSYNMHSFANTH